MRVKVHVDGLKELDANLALLEKRTAKRTLQKVLLEAAEPMAISMARRAPVDTGALGLSVTATKKAPHDHDIGKDVFRSVVTAGFSRGTAGKAANISRVIADYPFAEVFVGPGRHPQGVQQEFGNIYHGPQPFVRPAWDAKKKTTLALTVRGLRVEIDKAVSRMRRRRAR